jgi:hypothetical protein
MAIEHEMVRWVSGEDIQHLDLAPADAAFASHHFAKHP